MTIYIETQFGLTVKFAAELYQQPKIYFCYTLSKLSILKKLYCFHKT